jgi:hypothetical protein
LVNRRAPARITAKAAASRTRCMGGYLPRGR